MTTMDINTKGGPRQPKAVSGVQLAQGVGVQEARGFWADAWSQVFRRPGAICGMIWIGIVLFFAVFSPLLASGHPLMVRTLDTRSAVQARDAFAAEFGPGTAPTAGEVYLHLRQELAKHSPRLPVSAFLPIMPDSQVVARGQLTQIERALAGSEELNRSGGTVAFGSPLLRFLSASDVLLLIAGFAAPLWLLLPLPASRKQRAGILVAAFVQATLIVIAARIVAGQFSGAYVTDWARSVRQEPYFIPITATLIAAVLSLPFLAVPMTRRFSTRVALVGLVGVMSWWAIGGAAVPQVGVPFLAGKDRWQRPIERYDYRQREAAGQIRATYTLVPFSPNQASTSWFTREPGTKLSDVQAPGTVPPGSDARFVLGSDVVGQDVLSQMLHASRLSISIGLVSTSIAVVIGVTIGALMGYFGGWIDLMLYRVVEIFMAIPVLFLLIVAAAVLPRNTYVMMVIIGCVSWTGAARFVRAEFYKLRNQDFVQSARAVGLPLPSILFKHMLPNGVTPVLVDSSFAIAAAILAEAILSYLGLGPVGQPSWGRLLSGATSEVGAFVWWLAIFPGFAIFFTVLSYNLIGEAMRDAIDPKLKKARV
jgi:ABC-type dipeptide/oligopeptide/nickel transport system permease subunit